MQPFIEEIDRRVLVCDGAMGTMLYSKGVFVNRSFDALNLSQPDLVAEVHQAYIRAGADVIESNTFGANRAKLAGFGLTERLHAINVQGVRIARHAARDEAYVAGAIGPLGVRIEPWGRTGVDEAETFFREQASALLEGGVDLFMLETFRDLNEIGAAIAAVRSLCDLPIVAQMTTEDDGNSLDGTPPETFAPELERRGASLVGVNCSVGPAPMLETIERVAQVTRLKLSALPNAGKPREIEGRTIYLSSPEYMASYARRFIASGVRLVGGCCGTTPEHIRQIRGAVRAMAAPPRPVRVSVRGTAQVPADLPALTPIAREDKSRLARTLASGRFVVLVELLPPRGHDCGPMVAQVRMLGARGVDAITVQDGRRADARMSALSVSVLLEDQTGVETVLQYVCRERHLLEMQSDLLGAHAQGVRNLLVVTGDPSSEGIFADPSTAPDVDSIGLTNVVSRLNQGFDIGGKPFESPTGFHVGVAVNPTATDMDDEVRRFCYKVEAGAEFAVTTPVYDLEALQAFLTRVRDARIPIVAGLMPFESARHADFQANEVPGVRVPAPLVERMRQTDTPAEGVAEGIAIARELAAGLQNLVQGIQLFAPAGRIESALQVLKQVR
jgi:methionine synthase / methylenetetrahydrofolate reductase (NADH)